MARTAQQVEVHHKTGAASQTGVAARNQRAKSDAPLHRPAGKGGFADDALPRPRQVHAPAPVAWQQDVVADKAQTASRTQHATERHIAGIAGDGLGAQVGAHRVERGRAGRIEDAVERLHLRQADRSVTGAEKTAAAHQHHDAGRIVRVECQAGARRDRLCSACGVGGAEQAAHAGHRGAEIKAPQMAVQVAGINARERQIGRRPVGRHGRGQAIRCARSAHAGVEQVQQPPGFQVHHEQPGAVAGAVVAVAEQRHPAAVAQARDLGCRDAPADFIAGRAAADAQGVGHAGVGGVAELPQHAAGVKGLRVGHVECEDGAAASAHAAEQNRSPVARSPVDVAQGGRAVEKIALVVFVVRPHQLVDLRVAAAAAAQQQFAGQVGKQLLAAARVHDHCRHGGRGWVGYKRRSGTKGVQHAAVGADEQHVGSTTVRRRTAECGVRRPLGAAEQAVAEVALEHEQGVGIDQVANAPHDAARRAAAQAGVFGAAQPGQPVGGAGAAGRRTGRVERQRGALRRTQSIQAQGHTQTAVWVAGENAARSRRAGVHDLFGVPFRRTRCHAAVGAHLARDQRARPVGAAKTRGVEQRVGPQHSGTGGGRRARRLDPGDDALQHACQLGGKGIWVGGREKSAPAVESGVQQVVELGRVGRRWGPGGIGPGYRRAGGNGGISRCRVDRSGQAQRHAIGHHVLPERRILV